MVSSVRHVAVAITAVLHALSGVFLSVIALSLQRLFPSLKQLPPSFDYIPDLAEPPQTHSSVCRASGYSVDGVSSDENLLIPTPILDVDRGLGSDDHAAFLLASQARARAARPSLYTLSSSLWTLKEYPSPKLSQLGKERWATTTLSDVPPSTSSDSPSVSSFRLSTPPQEEKLSEAPSTGLKRKHSSHFFPLLPFHRKRCRPSSSPLSSISRHKSAASSPRLRELARGESSSDGHYHSHISVSKQVRKVIATPGRKCKGGKSKGSEKMTSSESASRAGRNHNRTDPYQAPYFFPTPLSPWADDYARLDRKLILNADVPPLSSAPVRHEDHRRRLSSSPGECVRSMWAPLRRRKGQSHSGNP